MPELSGQIGELRFTVEIKRKNTGKVEQSILRDDEDVADALMALHEYEARLLIGALGIATR